MTQINCAFCSAYATKIPGPTVHFSDWESAMVVLNKGAFWGLPLDSLLKRLQDVFLHTANEMRLRGECLYCRNKWENHASDCKLFRLYKELQGKQSLRK